MISRDPEGGLTPDDLDRSVIARIASMRASTSAACARRAAAGHGVEESHVRPFRAGDELPDRCAAAWGRASRQPPEAPGSRCSGASSRRLSESRTSRARSSTRTRFQPSAPARPVAPLLLPPACVARLPRRESTQDQLGLVEFPSDSPLQSDGGAAGAVFASTSWTPFVCAFAIILSSDRRVRISCRVW